MTRTPYTQYRTHPISSYTLHTRKALKGYRQCTLPFATKEYTHGAFPTVSCYKCMLMGAIVHTLLYIRKLYVSGSHCTFPFVHSKTAMHYAMPPLYKPFCTFTKPLHNARSMLAMYNEAMCIPHCTLRITVYIFGLYNAVSAYECTLPRAPPYVHIVYIYICYGRDCTMPFVHSQNIFHLGANVQSLLYIRIHTFFGGPLYIAFCTFAPCCRDPAALGQNVPARMSRLGRKVPKRADFSRETSFFCEGISASPRRCACAPRRTFAMGQNVPCVTKCPNRDRMSRMWKTAVTECPIVAGPLDV